MDKCTVFFRDPTIKPKEGHAVFITDTVVNLHTLDQKGDILSIITIPLDVIAYTQVRK